MKGEKTMFKRNEGILDRIVRVALSLVLLLTGLFLIGVLQSNVLGLVITGFGLWVLITGLVGFCPLYVPLGINTLEKEKELFARCRSMMASFRQGQAGGEQTGAGLGCKLCSPSTGEADHQPR